MPSKFKFRSYTPELLDAPYIRKELLIQNLQELDGINRLFGGHHVSLQGIKTLITDPHKMYHLVDLGCGSGDVMIYMARWARKQNFQVTFTGVDKNADAIGYLMNHCKNYPEIHGIVSDYRAYLETVKHIDIVHCALFCHHLNDEELFALLILLNQFTKTGFVINDLHRNWFLYHAVWGITHWTQGSVLSKNDGPLSVLRAFKRQELEELLNKTYVKSYSIKWKWAFRYLVTVSTC